jgi:hypothetical protein
MKPGALEPCPHHIFFSSQSDTPNRVGRSFIESCLKRAISELQALTPLSIGPTGTWRWTETPWLIVADGAFGGHTSIIFRWR